MMAKSVDEGLTRMCKSTHRGQGSKNFLLNPRGTSAGSSSRPGNRVLDLARYAPSAAVRQAGSIVRPAAAGSRRCTADESMSTTFFELAGG